MTFDYAAQPKETLKTCNLCGHEQFRVFAERDRYNLPVRSVECAHCGLVFINPRMTREAYRDFYANGTYRELVSEFHGRLINAQTIEPEQETYARDLLAFLEPFLDERPDAETLLDIGGSTGVVAAHIAKARGMEGTIMEPAPAEAERAEKRDLCVVPVTIEDYEPDTQEWDVILMCQTVDHLLDIAGSLATVKVILAPEGLFFVDIVDGGATKVDHPFRLDPETMEEFLEDAGFLVVSQSASDDGVHHRFLCEAA